MPYFKDLSALPDSLRKSLPREALEIYLNAFNHVWDEYLEEDSVFDLPDETPKPSFFFRLNAPKVNDFSLPMETAGRKSETGNPLTVSLYVPFHFCYPEPRQFT